MLARRDNVAGLRLKAEPAIQQPNEAPVGEYSDASELPGDETEWRFTWPGLSEMQTLMLQQTLIDEMQSPPSSARFLEMQRELSPAMRERLMRWLLALPVNRYFPSEVVYAAIRLFDTVAMHVPGIRVAEAQAYAAACHAIAAKMHVNIALRVCVCGAYDVEEQLFMERELAVVKLLGGHSSVPTVKVYLRLLMANYALDDAGREIVRFCTDVAAVSIELMDYRPSLVAVAAFALGLMCCRKPEWAREVLDQSLVRRSPDIRPCLRALYPRCQATAEAIRRSTVPGLPARLTGIDVTFDLSELGM